MSPRISALVSIGMMLLFIPGSAHRVIHNQTNQELSISSTGEMEIVEEVSGHQKKQRELVLGTILVKFGASVIFGLGKLAVKKLITEPRDWQAEMMWYSALLERAGFGKLDVENSEVQEALQELSDKVGTKTQEEFRKMKSKEIVGISGETFDDVNANQEVQQEALAAVSKQVGSDLCKVLQHGDRETDARVAETEQSMEQQESNARNAQPEQSIDEHGHHGIVAHAIEVPIDAALHLAVEEQIPIAGMVEILQNLAQHWAPEVVGEMSKQTIEDVASVISWSTLPIGMFISLFNTKWGTSADSKERFAFAFGSVIGELIAGLPLNDPKSKKRCSLVGVYKDLEDRLICWSHENVDETVINNWMQTHADGKGLDAPPNVTVDVDRYEVDPLPGSSQRFIEAFHDKVSNFASFCGDNHVQYLSMQRLVERGLCKTSHGNRSVSCDPQRPYVWLGETRDILNGADAKNFISEYGYVCLNPEGCHGGFLGGWKWCFVGDRDSRRCSVMKPEWNCGDLGDWTWDRCGSPCSKAIQADKDTLKRQIQELSHE